MNGVRVVPLPNGADEAQQPRGGVPAREALGRDELARLLDAAEQRIQSLHRSERLQQALYEIADLAGGSLELQDMLRRIHAIVGELMYAGNLYIVLYDEHLQTMRFLYFVDLIDPWVNDPAEEIPVTDDENTLTMHLLRTGEAMRGPSAELRQFHGIPFGESSGPDSADWLGVPMRRGSRVVGAIVVQNYEKPDVYSNEDRALLAYVAQHILTALDRKHAHEDLEQRITARTHELQRANHELQAEVVERKRAEKLQRALFRIAELAITSESLEAFYADVHAVVDELIYARNFYIALLSDDRKTLDFPYSIDERDPVRRSRKPGNGLTEHVIATGYPLLANRTLLAELSAQGKVHEYGTHAFSWLGVPLYRDEDVVGVIAVQSYSSQVSFSPQDQNLLNFVAHNIGNGPVRRRMLAAVLLMLTLFLWARVADLYRRDLVVTFIDVGQGDAALLEFPGRVRVLIDGGGRPEHLTGNYDVGRDVLLPYFRRRGIKYLDAVICTHPHEDHFQGLIALLEVMPVGLVVDNGEVGPTSAYERYRQLVRGGDYLTGRAGVRLASGISILHPPAAPLVGTTSDVNNNSIVCRVEFGEVSFLFTGDLDFEGQAYLLGQGVRLTADVLKYPHHGSRLAFNPSFLAAVSPRVCVISVGPNPFGQPAPAVLAFLAGAGVATYRTDLDGAVRVVTDGRSLRVIPARRNLLFGGERF